MAIERKRRVVLANPEEPKAGDFAYGFYDRTHPVDGDPEEIARMKRAIRGLLGETVTMRFGGEHIDDDGMSKKFTITRRFKLTNYDSVFGPGSAYASAIHTIRDKYSSDELVITKFTIDVASGDDEDSEEE